MKILLVTETWDATSGPYESLYPYYRAVLTARGHELRAVDNKKNYLPIGGRTAWDYPNALVGARAPVLNDVIVNIRVRRVCQAFQPELVLLTKCENIYRRTIAWVKEHTHAIVFNWDHDNPFWPANTSMELLRSIPLYDAFGIWGKFLFPALLSIGCRRVEFLPMFFVPERFALEGQSIRPAATGSPCDIAFVGNGSLERAEMLKSLVGFDIGIWGNWEFLDGNDPLRGHLRGGPLDGRRYAQVMRSARIGVNVLNLSNRPASNTRTFEVTGLGRMLLTEHTSEQADELFTEGKEIVCFRTPAELREKASYYLEHDQERERIARAGQERTMREHTLAHRLQRVLQIADELSS